MRHPSPTQNSDSLVGLPPAWREFFEERAGVREFDGGWPRAEAERLALAYTLRAMRRASQDGTNAPADR
jgi:hypothetical protein